MNQKEMRTLLVTSSGRRNELLALLETVCAKHNIRVIAADASQQSSVRLSQIPFYQLPNVTDATYFDELIKLCDHQKVTGLISLTDYENVWLSKQSSELHKKGVKWLGSSPKAIETADHKERFLTLCEKQNIPHSSLYSLSSAKDDWIKKPAKGSRSLGVERLKRDGISEDDYSGESSVIVEYLSGDEFTVDVLSDEQGIHLMVPRLRKQVRDGESVVGEARKNPLIEKIVRQIYEALPDLRGIWNVQGFLNKNDFKVTELNPRISGGLPLSLHAGANFFDWFVTELKEDVTFEPKSWRENVSMYRYWQGVYEG
jgi:carbamoyl-phosphate synthase large subunit